MANFLTRRQLLGSAIAVAALQTVGLPAQAGTQHVVEMLNKHPEDKKQRMVFHPRVLKVQPGDTVLFKSVDKSHNSVSIDGMLPEGAAPWKGDISADIEVTFDKPGFYGVKCTPHTSLGMVALIVVEGEGKLDNLEAAQGVKHKGKAKKVWKKIWKEAEDAGLLS